MFDQLAQQESGYESAKYLEVTGLECVMSKKEILEKFHMDSGCPCDRFMMAP